jgi:predicted nucleotidyltransferase
MVDDEEFLEQVFAAVDDAGLDRDAVRFVYLFGSYLEDPTTARDVDVCVSLDVENVGRAEYRLRGRVPEEMDVSVFETLPLQVQAEVFKGRLLYARDDEVYDVAYETFRRFETFEPLYKQAIGA